MAIYLEILTTEPQSLTHWERSSKADGTQPQTRFVAVGKNRALTAQPPRVMFQPISPALTHSQILSLNKYSSALTVCLSPKNPNPLKLEKEEKEREDSVINTAGKQL